MAERPEFVRQSAQLVKTWGRAGAKTQLVVDPGKYHFDVIDGLKDPQSDMTRTLLGLLFAQSGKVRGLTVSLI